METTSTVEDVEKSQSSYTAGKNVKWYGHFGQQLAIPQKVKHRVANSMATVPLLGIYPRERKMYVYTKICIREISSIIHNSQNVKITPNGHQSIHAYIKCGMSIQWILVSNKKKWSTDVYYHLDGLWKHYAKYKKHGTKDHTFYGSFIWSVHKW